MLFVQNYKKKLSELDVLKSYFECYNSLKYIINENEAI